MEIFSRSSLIPGFAESMVLHMDRMQRSSSSKSKGKSIMSQDITIHHSSVDGMFYLIQDRSSVHRHSSNALGNGFDTLEQAEQRKADIESGAWKDASSRTRIGFDPLNTSATAVSPNKAPAKKLTIRNEFTGREISVDPSKPLTPKKIAGWRSKLHCRDCMSGDDLGGRGKQEDQQAYDQLLFRAQKMLIWLGK